MRRIGEKFPEAEEEDRVSDDLAVTLGILRIIRRMSQSDLATAAGVTNSAISDYERGKVDPKSNTLRKISSGGSTSQSRSSIRPRPSSKPSGARWAAGAKGNPSRRRRSPWTSRVRAASMSCYGLRSRFSPEDRAGGQSHGRGVGEGFRQSS
jgi:transcriptional regulator with XRE-family HTH domain